MASLLEKPLQPETLKTNLLFAEIDKPDQKEFEPILSNMVTASKVDKIESPPTKRRKLSNSTTILPPPIIPPIPTNNINSQQPPPPKTNDSPKQPPNKTVEPTITPVSTPALPSSICPPAPIFEHDEEEYAAELEALSDDDLYKAWIEIRRKLGEIEDIPLLPQFDEFANISTEDLEREVQESEEWLRQDKQQTQLYCVCQQPYTDGGPAMIACEGCSGWFHLECMGLDERIIEGIEDWYCPRCDENHNANRSDDDSSDCEQTGFEDKSFEELVQLIISTKTKMYKEESERQRRTHAHELGKIQAREKQREEEFERIKTTTTSRMKKLEDQVTSLQKKESKLKEENRRLIRKANTFSAESESQTIKQLQEKLKQRDEDLCEAQQQSRDKSKQVHLLTLRISENDKEREAFEQRMIEVYQQRDSYRVQAEQLLTLLEELANGHQHENNQNGLFLEHIPNRSLQKVYSSKPSFKNLERNIQEKRVSFEEKTKQFKNEDKAFEKQRAHFIGKRRKYAEDFAKVVPLKNGGAKIFELQQKIRSEPKKQKEILSKAGLTGTAFFEQVSQNALSDDEPIQLIRPPRSSIKRKRMEQPDKRATKRVKKEGDKKQKRKRSKKKKDDKKKDNGKIKVKIEGRNGTTPRPFVGDGNEDVCRVCGKGGDGKFKLFCCDGCSAVYHRRCTRMKKKDETSRFSKSWLESLDHFYCNLCAPHNFHVPIRNKKTEELLPEKDWPLLIDRDKYLQSHSGCEVAYDIAKS